MGLLDHFFGPPSIDKFANTLLGELRKAGVTNARYDREQSRIFYGDGEVNLANIYLDHCRAQRSERAAHIRMLANIFSPGQREVPAGLDEARPNLRPKVWSRAGIEKTNLEVRLAGKEKGIEIPEYLVGSHLIASIAYDMPTSIRSVSPQELDDWGLSYYEALEIARENLENVGLTLGKLGEGFYTMLVGDHYDSARILLIDKIRELEVNGDPIAMAPTRDALFITGSQDELGLKCMVDLAEQCENDPRPMCAIPVRLDGDEWADWMPPQNHPLFEQFHVLELKYLAPEYLDQKTILDQLYEKEGEDVFVANYSLASKDDGPTVSYCMWAEDIHSLLPKTDFLIFYREGAGMIASGRWDRVQALVGSLMEEEQDLYPPRWRVREFPTDEQLEVIGSEM